jgi:hypothetical protein
VLAELVSQRLHQLSAWACDFDRSVAAIFGQFWMRSLTCWWHGMVGISCLAMREMNLGFKPLIARLILEQTWTNLIIKLI